ncbi:MAG: AI-2E family transporter [Treponema sp.]|nr:AI-2E family transporter [Treponema sp.]
MPETIKSKFKPLLPYFLFAIAVIIAYRVITETGFLAAAVGVVWAIVTPFFYGFLLAYIINVPYSGIQHLLQKSGVAFIGRKKKLCGGILTLMFFSLLLFLILRLLVPYVHGMASFFITNLPVYLGRVQQYFSQLDNLETLANLELFGISISTEGILAFLHERLQNISLENLAAPINALLGVPMAIFTAVLAFISAIYILIEKDKFKAFLCRLSLAFVPTNAHNAIMKYGQRLNHNFKRYIYVQTVDGLILGAIVTLQLLLLRSPYALILGLILGIINYIPYFGSIIGTLFAIVIVAFTQGLGVAAIAAVLLLVTQQIDGNIIQPKLMGGSFSLSPLLIIISITIGGAIAGILGMIAAIPIVAVLKDMLEGILSYHEQKKIKQG